MAGSRKTGARKKAKYIVDTEGSPAVRRKSGSQKEVRQTEGSLADRWKSGNRQAGGSQKLGRLHAGSRQTNRRQAGRQVERLRPL